MAIVNNEGGGGSGGGTVSDICSVSPSDMVGAIDNLISRIEDLEKTVSELMSANTSANQLSDLSQQAGWITGVTYLGEEGFTLTPAGTLIPPVGWTGFSSIIDGFEGNMYGSASARPRLHRDGSMVVDIATGTNDTLQIESSPSSVADTNYNGSTYLAPGTDPAGEYGWEVLVSGIYAVEIWVDVSNGTSVPTTGSFRLRLYKRRTTGALVTLASHGHSVNVGGGSFNNHIGFYASRRFLVGEYIRQVLFNFTDGDIQAQAITQLVTFERGI